MTDNINRHSNLFLYTLSTGATIDMLCPYATPIEEYKEAFADRTQPFLTYYTFEEAHVKSRNMTRGEFWDMACRGAAYLTDQGLSKGDRIVHCFSENSLYDLIFRLSATFTGCVPVTINWQADDNERLIYKATVTHSKLFLYDSGFRDKIKGIRSILPGKTFFHVEDIEKYDPAVSWIPPSLHYDDEKMIIFTAGTTGLPKGVSLSHRSYLANRLTFEDYFSLQQSTPLDLLLVNPLHHTNSSALSDWGMRRKGTIIHLIQRYSTPYWKILTEATHKKRGSLIAAMVPRHIDFLQSLIKTAQLPVHQSKVKEALRQIDILIGSAPVGPTTVKRILEFSGRYPRVRYGSTETCLQVMATPVTMTEEETRSSFEAGWNHEHRGEKQVGYYIGRDHPPFTTVRIVKAIDPGQKGYMHSCDIGEPGYLITRGANLMTEYVGQDEATKMVLRNGWYVGLRDIGFALQGRDGCLDYYWVTRDSALIIRGGANYSYEQIAADLTQFLVENFSLNPEQFKLAVIGLRITSEHEDSCCVTIELNEEVANREEEIKASFIEKACVTVSKGSRPDYVRFAKIPLSFKGAILIPQLKQDFEKYLKQ